jgi:hypothetical protein
MDEFGSCFTENRVNNFMINSVNYLKTAVDPNLGYTADGDRLVQQWLWFAMYDEVSGDVNALTNHPTNPSSLSLLGNTYENFISSENLYANLKALYSYGLEIGDTTDAELTVSVLNNGNHQVNDYTATFYRDAQLTNPIGSITVNNDVLNGCARETQTLSIVWPGLSDGVHYYWVKIENDLDNNLTDNVVQGFVIIGAEKTFLPIVKR